MTSPVVAGKYMLLRRLGQGGMAEVFLAKQEGLKGFAKLVVVKRILPHRAEDGEFVTMFLDEARTAADLRHPNIVNVFDINRDDGTYYMAMEFLHGHDVRAMMKAAAKRKEPIPLEHALEVVLGAASGLHYAHEKVGLDGRRLEIVHRDVSPQNLIVGFTGEVKVVDFGIAKAAHATTETEAGVVKGKFAYMAPEQARGETVSGLADQFALGAVMWELLVLRRLFKRKSEGATLMAVLEDDIPSVRMFRDDLPKALVKIVDKTLQRRPERRFASCGELREALEDLLAEERLAHSQARLGEYMRQLFEDSIEDEATLSEEQLGDGTGSKGSQSGRSLPPPDQTKPERGSSASKKSEPAVLGATRASPQRRASRSSPSEPEPPPEIDDEDDDEETRTTTVPSQPQTHAPRRAEPKPAPRPRPAPKPRREGPGPAARYGKVAAIACALVVVLLGAAAVGVRVASSLQTGVVIVRSTPKGAVLAVDGATIAEVTPHILRLPSGRHVVVSAALAGYVPESKELTVPPNGESVEVWFELKPGR